jgi:hypothetical protein
MATSANFITYVNFLASLLEALALWIMLTYPRDMGRLRLARMSVPAIWMIEKRQMYPVLSGVLMLQSWTLILRITSEYRRTVDNL